MDTGVPKKDEINTFWFVKESHPQLSSPVYIAAQCCANISLKAFKTAPTLLQFNVLAWRKRVR